MKRIKVAIGLLVIMLEAACSGESAVEVDTPSEESSAPVVYIEEETPDVPDVYRGEIFDCLDEDGFVNVYANKNEESEIIHVYDEITEVELLETLPFGWFKIRMRDGREGFVDARNIRTTEIPPHGYNKNLEGYVLVFTHEDQVLRVYKDGKFILSSIASSGVPELFTPRGIFEIEENRRGEWFFVERFDVGMKYWVGFKGIWLFHSVPFDRNKNVIPEEAAKLGSPASHGCIRLPVEIAEFIFNNVPDGSLVLIY